MSTDHFSEFLQSHPDTRYFDLFYSDLSCVIRGKRYPASLAKKVFSGGMMIPGGSFLLAANGECMDPEGMGFSDGDPDEVGMPIMQTIVPVPWAQFKTAQAMVTLQSLAGEPYYFEPRNVLKRVMDQFSTSGLNPMVAFELEFYLFDLNRGKDGELIPPPSPLTGQSPDTTQVYSMQDLEDYSVFFDEVIRCCEAQGIATGAISSEYAPGQFEINLQHTDDLLQAADHCVMFKRAVQSVARKQGMQASFMAKPYAEHSGSGLHLHVSLLDESGNNVFDGGGQYPNSDCGSEVLYHAIAGLNDSMADFLAVFSPGVNSYKRFVPNIYVPVSRSWAFENRSVAMRVPKSNGMARRIEHRIAGADANPYLTLAAILSGILHGIENKLDAGSPAQGNAGEQLDPGLPFEPAQAFTTFRESAIAQKYFGEKYVNAYSSCKIAEYEAFTDRNLKDTDWYL